MVLIATSSISVQTVGDLEMPLLIALEHLKCVLNKFGESRAEGFAK